MLAHHNNAVCLPYVVTAAHAEDSDNGSPLSSAGMPLQGAFANRAGGEATAAAAGQGQQPPVPRCSSVAELWSDLSPEEVQVRMCVICVMTARGQSCKAPDV